LREQAVKVEDAALRAEVERLRAELRHAQARIAELEARADVDPLLEILNRRGFERELARAIAYVGRYSTPAVLMFIDLDDFKLVNDRHGHAAGDRLLVEAVIAWERVLRRSDVLARLGGDEFVVVMPRTSRDEADGVLTRLRAAHPVRFSAGVTRWRPQESLEACLARADERLYAAKRRAQA
jgi:diguanylate cyclase (GGDEF)-like protein